MRVKINLGLFFFFALLTLSVDAQERYNNIWLFGHIPNRPIDYFGGSKLDFSTNSPKVKYFNIKTYLTDCNIISNANGNLMLYSNGCEVYDSNNLIIANGTKINPGEVYDEYCLDILYPFYPSSSSGIMLPGFDTNSYYYVHKDDQLHGALNNLYVTKIVKSISNKLIVTENKVVGKLDLADGIQAIRNGNGRDWWIFIHSNISNLFVSYLLTSNELLGPYFQYIGNKWDGVGNTVQSVFSPDGAWYAISSEYYGAAIYNFDRCKGKLSNYHKLNGPTPELIPLGVCFSPNSKYLFLSANSFLYQYDLTDKGGISNSRTLIDVIDTFRLPYIFPTSFYQLTLGPDNKIYCNTTSETNVLHVIHYPDKWGKDCGLKQHDILLPSTYGQSMPNFPMFRVYDMDGSPCDTLGIDKLPLARFRFNQDILIYLNFEFIDLSLFNVTEWNWDFGDNLSGSNSSKMQNPTHEFTNAGSYNVCLTTRNKHGQDIYCQIVNIGTVTDSKSLDINIHKEFVLIPNPCLDYLIIQVNNYNPEKMEAILYNSIGEVVSVNRIQSGRNTININNLNKGFYIVNIFNKNVLVKQDKILKL